MAKASFKERARQQREQEILHTAARLMQARGYNELNMDEIAEEVGVSKPTLYQHFKSKEDMVMQVLLQSVTRMDAHMDALPVTTPLQQLEHILRSLLMTHFDPEELPATMADPHMLIRAQNHEVFNARYREVGMKLRNIVQAGFAQGQINPNLSEMVVISTLFSLLTVLQGPAIMQDDTGTQAALIDEIVTVFINGIKAH